MRYVKVDETSFKTFPTGENVAILVGRHSQHGASERQTVAYVELAPGCASDTHYHAEREESYYFLSGQGIAEIQGEEHAVEPNVLIHAMPGEKHRFLNNGEAVLRYLVITTPAWVPQDSLV